MLARRCFETALLCRKDFFECSGRGGFGQQMFQFGVGGSVQAGLVGRQVGFWKPYPEQLPQRPQLALVLTTMDALLHALL